MSLYSQRDPSYDRKTLGDSQLTIHGYGCFLVSLANLYQKQPVELLSIPKAFTPDGLLIASVIASYCGGEALPPQSSPPALNQWCIAMTDHYAAQGYPTHFFCYNYQTDEMIDPLKFPAVIEKRTYKIKQYRPFSNPKLTKASATVVGPFPDVAADRFSSKEIQWAKDNKIMKGYDSGIFEPTKPVTREELAIVAKRLYDFSQL